MHSDRATRESETQRLLGLSLVPFRVNVLDAQKEKLKIGAKIGSPGLVAGL